jgi:acetyl-CoA carboxylase biotin carboxyl carrier protein
MELKYLKAIIKEFTSSDIHRLKIEENGTIISLEKEDKQYVQAAAAPVVTQEIPTAPQPQAVATVDHVEENVETINAPLVGTYYEAPSPNDAAFVKVGDFVKEGQTVCIIEAMKVMNEIKAPQSGIIREILVVNENLVEFDQPLMVIE